MSTLKLEERRLYKYVNVTSPAWLDTLFWLNDQGRDTSGLWQFKDWSIRGVCGVGGYWRILWFFDIRDDYILIIEKIVLYLCILQIWGDWGVWGVRGDLSLGIW